MNIDGPSYPVLMMSRDGSIVPCDRADTLGRCNAIALWRNRYFSDMTIIDSGARFWRVSGVTVLEPAGRLGQILARLTNGSLVVDVQLKPRTGESGMEAVREMIASLLDHDPDFWEASADLQEWKSSVRVAKTMSELMTLFRTEEPG